MARTKKAKSEPPIDNRTPEEKLTAEFKHQFIPEPTRIFNIGESVSVGSLEDAIVKDIYCDGKYYLIEYTERPNRFDKSVTTRVTRDFKWMDVCVADSKAPRFTSERRENQIHSYSTHLSGLVLNYYHFGIDMNPDYQRGYVWDLEDKRKLIDSIFKEAKIGLFVLNKKPFSPTGPQSEIIDGKQRLTAIIEFIEDRFDYKGYKWSELQKADRDRFRTHMIEMAELEEADEKTILRTFLKINRTGRAITEEHLNKVEKMLEDLEKKDV